MLLREEFESSGNWLFRWRSFLPVAGLAIVVLSLRGYDYPGHSARLDHLWELLCIATSLTGLAIRAYTIGYTPRSTSGRNSRKQRAVTLNTTGAYSLVRNPLYLGNFIMGLGIALFVHHWWLVLIYTLIFWLYYERIIFAEEAYLTKRFGHEYTDWAAHTPAFIPRLTGYRPPGLPFSLKNVLRREYNGFFAVILLLFLLELTGDLIVQHRLHIETPWAIMLAASFLIWLTLRTLKRHTTLLRVDGR